MFQPPEFSRKCFIYIYNSNLAALKKPKKGLTLTVSELKDLEMYLDIYDLLPQRI
jgi:hypothetical protein